MTTNPDLLSEVSSPCDLPSVPFGVRKLPSWKAVNIQNKFPKPQASSKKKKDLFKDLGARAWISPHISEAYLKNINTCFRIFRMFSSTPHTQTIKPNLKIPSPFFFGSPKKLRSKGFRNAVIFQALQRTHENFLDFYSTTLDRQVCFDPFRTLDCFNVFFNAKNPEQNFFINQCWTILRTISGSKYGDDHGVIVLAVQNPCWTCDFERSKCWGQFQTILIRSFFGYLKQPVLCFREVLELLRVVGFEFFRAAVDRVNLLLKHSKKNTAHLSNPIVLISGIIWINHLEISGQES